MIYLKIQDTLYPAGFRKRVQDADWKNRETWAITVTMSHAQASELFVDGMRWQQVQQRQPYADADGNKITPEPVITDCSEYEVAGPITDNRDGTVTVKMGKALSSECNAALTGEASTMTVREATELRGHMETVFEKAAPVMTNDEVISNRVLCKVWEAGKHTAGEVYSTGEQIWQCIQDYDNAVYPDITPGNPAWNTFHKPYHGTTKETAMPWVAPTGAHDMYLSGEYMLWTDGMIYKCKMDTAYNPEEYAGAWEVAA
jgi:hypothetical protein